MYIKSRDLADENNKILTKWKRFETTVLEQFSKMRITLFGCKFVIEKKHHMWLFFLFILLKLTFSVKYRYQLNYFICIKDFNADKYFFKIKFVFFLYLRLSASSKENDLPLFGIFKLLPTRHRYYLPFNTVVSNLVNYDHFPSFSCLDVWTHYKDDYSLSNKNLRRNQRSSQVLLNSTPVLATIVSSVMWLGNMYAIIGTVMLILTTNIVRHEEEDSLYRKVCRLSVEKHFQQR
jgi:hypothetical protein